jgi:hypothetical protein
MYKYENFLFNTRKSTNSFLSVPVSSFSFLFNTSVSSVRKHHTWWPGMERKREKRLGFSPLFPGVEGGFFFSSEKQKNRRGDLL